MRYRSDSRRCLVSTKPAPGCSSRCRSECTRTHRASRHRSPSRRSVDRWRSGSMPSARYEGDCRPSIPRFPGALHEVPSHVRLFGLLTVFVPVFDRYEIQASSPKVFDSLQAMCGLLLESVETVGMNPGLVSSTFVTACQ